LYFDDVADYWTPAVDAEYRVDEPMALTIFYVVPFSALRWGVGAR